MTNKAPPVPRDNQSLKGIGSADKPQDDKPDKVPANPNEQGRQGNLRQNTRKPRLASGALRAEAAARARQPMHLLPTKNVTAVNNFPCSMFLVHGPRGG